MDILKAFKLLNYSLGTIIVLNGFYIYFATDEILPLYLALAIIIAGPLEDFLIACIQRSPALSPADKEKYASIVDNTTSLAFLSLLGLAILTVQ